MSKPWIFVSPASRGIGHALTRHLLRITTVPVLATARTGLPDVRASLLDSLYASTPERGKGGDQDTEIATATAAASQRLHMARVDVTDESTLRSASAEAAALFPPSTHHLRLAFALPGVLHPEKSPREVDYANALRTFQVNVLGPLMLMKWFGDFLPRKSTTFSPEPLFTSVPTPTPFDRPPTSTLNPNPDPNPNTSPNSRPNPNPNSEPDPGSSNSTPRSAIWLTASARVGSTSDNRLGGWYTYRASKAGVTSVTRTFDGHLRARGGGAAAAVAYHPGTVRTGLSRAYWGRVPADRLFEPEDAAARMVDVVRGLKVEEHRGRCWDWRGQEILP